jgi:hypothetical protein
LKTFNKKIFSHRRKCISDKKTINMAKKKVKAKAKTRGGTPLPPPPKKKK